MKYTIAHDFSDSYAKYFTTDTESKFLLMRNKVIGKETSPRRDAQLAAKFRNTNEEVVALFGLELGFIGDVAQNHKMKYKISPEIFKAIEETDIRSILSADACESVVEMYLMHPDVSYAIQFLEWVEMMGFEDRPRWEMHIQIQLNKFYKLMNDDPDELLANFFLTLIHHPEREILSNRLLQHGKFNALFYKYQDKISEAHERSNHPDKEIPIEILAGLNGFI